MYSDDDYLIDREECVNAYYKELKQQIETAESTEEILEIVNNVIETKDKKIKELEEENADLKIKNNSRIIGTYAEVRLEETIKDEYIPKQKAKEILDRLHISNIEPWSIYKVSGDVLFDLKELLEDK